MEMYLFFHCLQLLSDRLQALEVQIDSLCESASSSDDRITNLFTKCKTVCTAVNVSQATRTYL